MMLQLAMGMRGAAEVLTADVCYSKFLVTGGAGFIGSHLVDELARLGGEVWVLDDFSSGTRDNLRAVTNRENVHIIKGDVRDADNTLKLAREVEVVYHLAAKTSLQESAEDPISVNDINVTGTLAMLRASASAGVERFVLGSSAAVYGEPFYLPIDEEHPLAPLSCYGASKAAAEKYCSAFTHTHGLRTVCLRLFNVYGARQLRNQYSGVIVEFMELLMRGRSPVIFGDGWQSRDFVNVLDVVQAFLRCLETDSAVPEVYNVGSGISTSVNELASMLIETTGADVEPEYDEPRPYEITHSVSDISRASGAFGYAPRYSLDESIPSVVEWMRMNLEKRSAPRPYQK